MQTAELRNEFYQHLRKIIQSLSIHSKQLNKNFGLTGPQLLILKAIAKEEHSTIGKLAGTISLSQATVTTILDRLEARGLVERVRSSVDKRKVMVHTTEAADTVLSQDPTILPPQFIERFDSLDNATQNQLMDAISRTAGLLSSAEEVHHDHEIEFANTGMEIE